MKVIFWYDEFKHDQMKNAFALMSIKSPLHLQIKLGSIFYVGIKCYQYFQYGHYDITIQTLVHIQSNPH